MKKNLIIPVMGVVVLAACVIFYLNQTTDKNNKQEEISNLVFETPDFCLLYTSPSPRDGW